MAAENQTRAEILARFRHNIFPRQGGGLRPAISIILLFLLSGIPAFEYAGFYERSLWRQLPFGLVLGISAIAGMIAGAIYYPEWKYWYVGLLPGMFAGPSVVLMTYWYSQSQERMTKIELSLLFFAGIAPAFVGYYFLLRWIVLHEAGSDVDMTTSDETSNSA